jgi:hypothetical protein
LEPYLDLLGYLAATVAVLHEPGGGAQLPESAISLVAIPGPYVEAIGVGEIAVALFGPTEACDRNSGMDKIPFTWPDGHRFEVDEHGLPSAEEDVTHFGLPVDDATWQRRLYMI